MSLPYGVMGRSAVCGCCISWLKALVERRRVLDFQIALSIMGINVFKIFIWGGISSDIRSEI